MNLPTLNSEYCYMLTSCDFASTIGDLTKLTAKEGSMHPLDIVKQAIQELIDGRDHSLSAAEQDDMKLSLARLLLCLCLRSRLNDEPELAEFLTLFPDMGEDFLLAVVFETGLTKAFVQNLCELDSDLGKPILTSMTSSLIDPSHLFLAVVRTSDQLSKLIANKASVPVNVATNAHAYLRHQLTLLEPPQQARNSPEMIGELICLLDSYIDAYCLKEKRRSTLTSMYNPSTDADKIFGDLFMLSHGLYLDLDMHPTLDTNANKLLNILDEIVRDIDMAKVKSESVDFYQLWSQSRRLRQVLRQKEDRNLASKVEKFESRLRYRLLKASKFTEDTKIDDCIFLLGKNICQREITGVLIDMLVEPVSSAKIVAYLEKNLILLCDAEFLVRLVRVTRLTKIQLKTKKCKNQLNDLLRKAFMKSNARTQNEVILGAHKDGVETMTFVDSSNNNNHQESIQVLNRLTLEEEVYSTYSDVAWLALQKPREILEQILQLASSNADYCKVVHKLLDVLPNIGLVQIGDEVRMSNLVICVRNVLTTELSEQQESNLISLYAGLLQSPCLNSQELVLEVIFRSLNVDCLKSENRAPFNFSLAILERLLKLRTLWQVTNVPSIMSVLYCLCEVVDYTGKDVYHKQHSDIKERAKNTINDLSRIWQYEKFDTRVAIWLEKKLNTLESTTQFLFMEFDPYPQKRLKSTLVKSTVDFLRAEEPTDIHAGLLTILSLSSLNETTLGYFRNLSGERHVPYSVLVTSLVQRMPNSTLEELTRSYELLTSWLRRGTIRIRDRRVGVVPFVSKIWLDAVLVLVHPDMGWVERNMKIYVVRNYAQLLKRMSSESQENEDCVRILRNGLEAVSKLDVDLAEPLLILTLDIVKNLKSMNADLASVSKLDLLQQSGRSDLAKIAANLK